MSMYKYFKTPNEVQDTSAVIKALKKSIRRLREKGEVVRFLSKGEFPYAEKTGSFLFIGTPKGDWKEYIREHKTDDDFAMGFCRIQSGSEGAVELHLQTVKGRGDKKKYLLSMNKDLLRRVPAEAVFVKEVLSKEEAEDMDSESLAEPENEAQAALIKELYANLKIIQHDFKSFQQLLQSDQPDGAKAKMEEVLDLIEEWKALHEEANVPIEDKIRDFIAKMEQTIRQNAPKVVQKEAGYKVKLLEQKVVEYQKLTPTEALEQPELEEQIEDIIEDLDELGIDIQI